MRENYDSPLDLIDQKIQYHQAILSDLKTQKNRLMPISKIPPEVLYSIFFLASRDAGYWSLQWIKVTHVCRGWRKLALSSPSLWCFPPFQNPRWAKEMLIRSKLAKITIKADVSVFNDLEKRRTLFNAFETHMPQIKLIELTLCSEHTDLAEHLLGSAPNLEALTVFRFPPWATSDPIILKKDSLCGMDRLRWIDLTGIGIDWDSHLPSSLTSLKLSYIHHSSLPTMAQVWDALERMPLLETLELAEALPTASEPISSDREIHLYHLRQLSLGIGIAETECFLRTVIFPPTTISDIRCLQDSPTGYFNYNEIITHLGRSAKNRMSKIERLVVQYITHSYVTDKVSTMKILCFSSERGQEDHQSSHFQVSWYHGENFEEDHGASRPRTLIPEQILLSLFQQFPFDFVFVLDLKGPLYYFSLPILLKTFGSLPRLQDMIVQLGPSLLDALKSDLPLTDGLTVPGVSFSGLRSMTIRNTVFRDDPRHPRGEISFENLLDCLFWRIQHGVRVQRLDFKNCDNCTEPDITLLKDIVPQVEWDGRGGKNWGESYSEEEFESNSEIGMDSDGSISWLDDAE